MSKVSSGSLTLSDNAFQPDGLATENSRQPNVFRRHRGTISRSQVLTSSDLRRRREEACQVLWSCPMTVANGMPVLPTA